MKFWLLMAKLNSKTINDTHILKRLSIAKIYSVNDFIQADVEKLVSSSDLTEEKVLKLKHELILEFASQPATGLQLYMSARNNIFIRTHIRGIDDLLGGGVIKGSILEFCGLSGCGKSQICHSIAVNNALLNSAPVEYIDTKNDFSAARCNILLPTGLHDVDMDGILENINVFSVKDIYQLISILETLNISFQSNSRLIIIDSVTVPYLPLIGTSSNIGLSLLNYIASSLKKLAIERNAAIILTNLGIQFTEIEEEDKSNKKGDKEIKPLMGKYWVHVPNTRVIINRESALATKRTLTIKKSDYIEVKRAGTVEINSNGVR